MLDSFIHGVSGDGSWYDEELGESDGFGWHALIINLSVEDLERGMKGIPSFANESMNDAEKEFLTENPSLIMREDSQGFVSVTYYAHASDAKKAWARIEKRFEEAEREAEENEEEEDEETCPNCGLYFHACECGNE
jgi:hypothetical protein